MIVVDVAELLIARTAPLRRRLERRRRPCSRCPATAIGAGHRRPRSRGRRHRRRPMVETNEPRPGRHRPAASWSRRSVGFDGGLAAEVGAAARSGGRRRLGGVASCVSLADLEPVGDDAATVIARRWQQAGRDPAPVARLGVSADGIVDIDLGARRSPRARRRHHRIGQERAAADDRGVARRQVGPDARDDRSSSTTRAARPSTRAHGCRTPSAWSPTSTMTLPNGSS